MIGLSRRRFVTVGGAAGAAAAAGLLPAGARAAPPQGPPKFRLGIVTYNIAAAWDLPTLLKICRAVGLSPVELRTTHKHGVEPSLNAAQRKEVRQRFADAGIGGIRIEHNYLVTDQAFERLSQHTIALR